MTRRSMTWERAAEEILASLEGEGFGDAEVYVKEGRARRVVLDGEARSWCDAREIGWASRAGSARGSFFFARAGAPRPAAWPTAGPGRIALPPPLAEDPWRDPESDRPLFTEGEASEVLARLALRLRQELPGATIGQCFIEDGASTSEIFSSRGARCRVLRRAAAIRAEAALRSRTRASHVDLYAAARTARHFRPSVVAKQLAERLVLDGGDPLGEESHSDCTLAPEVAARFLAGCLDRLVGPAATSRGPNHRWGSEGITISDDPRLFGQPLSVPRDGEGMPTRRVALVESGRWTQPLLAWWQSSDDPSLASGCTRRPSWRDVPTVGPTQLSIEPGRSPGTDLVRSLERGFHWCEALGDGIFDSDADRFVLPVTGYSIAPGRAPIPIRRAAITGTITGFLESIDGVGDDRRFIAGRALFGSPTLRVPRLKVEPIEG